MQNKILPTESFELELAYQTEIQGFSWKSVGEIRYKYIN